MRQPLTIRIARFLAILSCALLIGMQNNVQAKDLPESFAPMVEKLMPAVVNISTTQTIKGVPSPFEGFQFDFPPGSPLEGLPELFNQFKRHNDNGDGDGDGSVEQKVNSLGSGFIIDPAGYIVTNNHVIDKADEITVILSDNTRLSAKLIGKDPKTDVALLKVNAHKELPYVKWGDSDEARVGDWVIAIGNPFGLGGSVSAGIISARARDINAGPFDDFLQTDAAINRGNSGGPLFDTDGNVIGINTAIFSPSGGNVGIGFATPSSLVKPIINQLKTDGKILRGWLGVKIQTVSEDIAESIGLNKTEGALVVDVTPKSPAADAGLKTGDVIIEFNDHDVSTMRKLPRMVAELKPGTRVELTAWRDGHKKTFHVKLGELPVAQTASTDKSDSKKHEEDLDKSSEQLGMWLRPLTDDDRKLFAIDDSVKGLMVVKTTPDSESAKKGIMRGDVIISANQHSLDSADDLKDVIKDAKKAGRNAVLLLLQRGKNTQFIAVPLSKKK